MGPGIFPGIVNPDLAAIFGRSLKLLIPRATSPSEHHALCRSTHSETQLRRFALMRGIALSSLSGFGGKSGGLIEPRNVGERANLEYAFGWQPVRRFEIFKNSQKIMYQSCRG